MLINWCLNWPHIFIVLSVFVIILFLVGNACSYKFWDKGLDEWDSQHITVLEWLFCWLLPAEILAVIWCVILWLFTG